MKRVPHRFVVDRSLYRLAQGANADFYNLVLPCKLIKAGNKETSCPGCVSAKELCKVLRRQGKIVDPMPPVTHVCLNCGNLPNAGYNTYALKIRKDRKSFRFYWR